MRRGPHSGSSQLDNELESRIHPASPTTTTLLPLVATVGLVFGLQALAPPFITGAGGKWVRPENDYNPYLVACHDSKNPQPWPNAPLTAGARTPPNDGFFDTAANYIGAFKDANDSWMAGWTRFDDK